MPKRSLRRTVVQFEARGMRSLFAAERTGRGTNPWGAEVAGFAATAKISSKGFGMELNMPLDGGGFLVGDEVKIAIDREAVRQG